MTGTLNGNSAPTRAERVYAELHADILTGRQPAPRPAQPPGSGYVLRGAALPYLQDLHHASGQHVLAGRTRRAPGGPGRAAVGARGRPGIPAVIAVARAISRGPDQPGRAKTAAVT